MFGITVIIKGHDSGSYIPHGMDIHIIYILNLYILCGILNHDFTIHPINVIYIT